VIRDAPGEIGLDEYRPRLLPRAALTDRDGDRLWNDYKNQMEIGFPSPATGDQWRLTAQGWVGYIPLSPELRIALRPKVPIQRLFGMMEYAYGQKTFQILEGRYPAETLDEAYERLAEVLARRVLRRARDGLVRAYVSQTEELAVVRGSLNVRRMATRPWDTRLECSYQEHTADIDDNQILAWTLFVIGRSGLCRPDRALPTVQRAFHQLQRAVTLTPVSATACVGRRYHRLNADYAPLHALCRFFLYTSGPHHTAGDRTMLPFLINMAGLFEEFVAGWMRARLPHAVRLVDQEHHTIGKGSGLSFVIDLVLRDHVTGKALAVLDTKYKCEVKTDDIAQVVAYAEMTGCTEAVLVYPIAPQRPLDARIGAIRVRSLAFDLDSDLNDAGERFLAALSITDIRGAA